MAQMENNTSVYKDIAEELYRSFKSQVIWKMVDFKRINKFEKIIKKRFILELSKEVELLKSTPDTNINPEKMASIIKEVEDIIEPSDRLVQVDHQTLLQRIIETQDQQLEVELKKDIEEQQNIEIHTYNTTNTRLNEFETLVGNLTNKRYLIEIHCNGIIKKPNFQIFKDPDIIEKDIKTDNITRHTLVFKGYVDTHDKKIIHAVVNESFQNASVVNIQEVALDEIPPIYKNIWQNRTNL